MRLSEIFAMLVLAVCVAWCAPALGQSGPQRPAPQYGQPPEDLANALVQMARASRVPLVAELVWPLPSIPTAEGKPLDPDTLDDLVRQAPDYEWKMEGKAVHFYCKTLRRARFNFLNLRFPRFAVPADLSELKLRFASEASGLLYGYNGSGWATTGFGDALLERQKLHEDTLEDITPLDVLIYIANESPTFYTVLVFPSAAPTKSDAKKRVVWQWGSLDEKLGPVYTQPPPRK